MTLKNPLVIAGKIWDRFSVNIAISSRYNPDGSSDASVALRLIPTRINEDGAVETLDSEAVSVFRGRYAEFKSAAEAACASKISAALDEYVQSLYP